MSPSFRFFDQESFARFFTPREGETKLGQEVRFLVATLDELSDVEAEFVVVGIPEDIGVRANFGRGGANTAFPDFLSSFLNIQSSSSLPGSDVVVAGFFEFPDMARASIAALRSFVETIDAEVVEVVQTILRHRKIPIVIGGGHNNAYPLLKACAETFGEAVHCVNLDAHSDFRPREGRHSGNGFRYAYEEGFLRKYALLGLHEPYNHEAILKEMSADSNFQLHFWEDLFLRKTSSWSEMLAKASAHVAGKPFGVELDLDVIESALSSAMTPVGLSAREAMEYCYFFGGHANAVYLHLPEAIRERDDGLQSALTGKLLSYLVQAFCKGVRERRRNLPSN